MCKNMSEHFDGETLVVIHHAPHRKALIQENILGPFYASNLQKLILKHQPKR